MGDVCHLGGLWQTKAPWTGGSLTYCLLDTHTVVDTPYVPAHKQSSAPTGLAHHKLGNQTTRLPAAQQQSAGATGLVQICRAYNLPEGAQCRFVGCWYAHPCDRCHRPRLEAECKKCGRGGIRSRSQVRLRRWE